MSARSQSVLCSLFLVVGFGLTDVAAQGGCSGTLEMARYRVVPDRYGPDEAVVTWEVQVEDATRRGARYVVAWRYDIHYSYRNTITGDREDEVKTYLFQRVPSLRGPGSHRSQSRDQLTIGSGGIGTQYRIDENRLL